MEYLFDGVREFNSRDYHEYRGLFEKLGKRQEPHTLFIGCSDSRIVPNLITNTLPGDLFVIRNVANIVPIYHESEEFLATTSAIEYALEALRVENIVVCGHSNCGGCNALYMSDEELARLPHTRKWLQLAAHVREQIEKEPGIHADPIRREWMTEQLNIIEQINHLLTYPGVMERYLKKELNILGWYYIIETGEIFNYDIAQKRFVKITK